jgi:TRAP-type C4-dicarboxylate transport system substrate-binding protein
MKGRDVMKKRLSVAVTVLVICFFFMSGLNTGLLSQSSAEAASAKGDLPEITLKYSAVTSQGSSTERYYVMPFSDWIKRESKGKLKLEYFPSGVLAKAPEMFDAVSAGLVDVALGIGAYSTKIPEGALETGLPFLPLTLKEIFDLYSEHGVVELLRETYSKYNVYYVNSVPSMEYRLLTRFPVTSLEDIKGKKIRATGFLAKAIKAVGGTPASIAGKEIYMAAQRGVVDGIAYPLWALERYKFKEVTKYILLDNLGPTVVNFIVNMKTWSKLPKEYQEIIHRASVHATLSGIVGITAEDEIAKLKAEQYGLKTTRLTDAARNEWIRKATGLWEEYAQSKGEQAVKELGIIKDYLRSQGKIQ